MLVLPTSYINNYSDLLKAYPKLKIIEGGQERWESVQNGINQLDSNVSHVLIHDIARPFVPSNIIKNCLMAFSQYNNFVTGLLCQDTIKQVQNDNIIKTLNRSNLIQVQTPQGFAIKNLKECYQNINTKQINNIWTDEAQILEYFGYTINWIKGSTKKP